MNPPPLPPAASRSFFIRQTAWLPNGLLYVMAYSFPIMFVLMAISDGHLLVAKGLGISFVLFVFAAVMLRARGVLTDARRNN